MRKHNTLSDPPRVLGDSKVAATHNQPLLSGISQRFSNSPPLLPAPPRSLAYLDGRPLIAPRSNLARSLIAMGSEVSTSQEAGSATNDLTTSFPPGANYAATQKPASNLTVLLNQHDCIQSGGEAGIDSSRVHSDRQPITCMDADRDAAVPGDDDVQRRQSRTMISNKNTVLDGPESSSPANRRSCRVVEADSASGPPPSRTKVLGSSAPSQFPRVVPRTSTLTGLPRFLPPPILAQQSTGSYTTKSNCGTLSTGIFQLSSSRVRRCMSSKELGTLAPPSGSPYAKMIYQKETLEVSMRQKLATMRESAPENICQSEESSSTSSRAKIERVNEMRNLRRAQHAQAVVDDLCNVVADLFLAESKLLVPSNYGVVPSTQRVQIVNNIYEFVTSLPLRYALGADTPSEVLLHMRLMAAVRHDKTKATVHIHNLSDDSNWSLTVAAASEKANRSLRLVTISCNDADGLLEYITRLLATGGSRVLDADVMLSTDGVVLDRFVVDMSGRLRLDKLSNLIEAFLQDSCASAGIQQAVGDESAMSNDSKATNDEDEPPTASVKRDIEPAGPLYYKADEIPEVWQNDNTQQQEIESAVPLVEMLASSKSQGDFQAPTLPELRRHLSSTPQGSSFRLPMRTSLPTFTMFHSENDGSEDAPLPLAQTEEQPKSKHDNKRVLVDRPAASNLDNIGNDINGEDSSLDFVTVHASLGTGLEQRVVPLIPFDELMLIETIGAGRVSTIYRAAWQRNHRAIPSPVQMVALKVAMVNPVTNDTANVDELRREADIAARLDHPNVVDLVGVAADSECFCLAYDFCEGGSLLSLLSDHRRYYEYLPIALDIANGMAYLHSRNVIHRDLKPSNILLTRDHRAKIADFGMSVANFGQELTAETGTYRYMAPEVVRHESYSSNADVYSFGLCLWQLITREVPFANMTPIQAAYAVAEGRRPAIPVDTPHRLREIISSCWHQDSLRRPSFTYITMALADYAKMAFSPANVGALTLQIANETLANVEGNSTVNVDFTTPVGMFVSPGSNSVAFGISRHDSIHSNVGLEIE